MRKSVTTQSILACITTVCLISLLLGVCASAAPDLPLGSKLDSDGSRVLLKNMTVTAVFTDCCYAETDNGTWGIKVCSSDGDYPDPGTCCDVWGTLESNSDGERYLLAEDGDFVGTSKIKPVFMTNRTIGGGNFNFESATGKGQMGITGATGLNNVGMLVKTTGACVVNSDGRTFTVSDGSDSGITCVPPDNVVPSSAWQYVAVTGISSIQKTDETYSRLLRVTKIEPLISSAPEGVTGRWETATTSGDAAGAYGMLLNQSGETVTGYMRGLAITNGHVSGDTFTYSMQAPGGPMIEASFTQAGDTLSGTWTTDDESIPVTFSRLSADPISPYSDRPKLISATFNGHDSLEFTWDRPVSGWDCDIKRADGESILDRSGDNQPQYDPATYTYHIPVTLSSPMSPGEHYTVYADSGYTTDWFDPYGLAAWDDPSDCYKFDYVCQPAASAPDIILGYPANGVEQSITIAASWPDTASSLKLYSSADGSNWLPVSATPTKQGAMGEFTLQTSSDGYYYVTALNANGESAPSAVVHARPSAFEPNGVTIQTPTDGDQGIPLSPLMSWLPSWTQSTEVSRYACVVTDKTSGDCMWSPLTDKTSLIYGQTSGVMSPGPATSLTTGATYALRVGAFDAENWMFASSPKVSFTVTTSGTGGTADENAVAALYASLKSALESHDIDSFIGLFSQDYMHNGKDRAALESNMTEDGGISSITSVQYNINSISFSDIHANVNANIVVTFQDGSSIVLSEPDNNENGIGMGWLIQENGVWKVYGNQIHSNAKVHTVRQSDGTYELRFQARGQDLDSVTVSGPGVDQEPLNWDAASNGFTQWIVPKQTPVVGDTYTFNLTYKDGHSETTPSVVQSLVPVSPTISANVQSDRSIVFTWNDISSQVTDASGYSVSVTDTSGGGFMWSNNEIDLSATSITTPQLEAGKTYHCEFSIFDEWDDSASCAVDVTIH